MRSGISTLSRLRIEQNETFAVDAARLTGALEDQQTLPDLLAHFVGPLVILGYGFVLGLCPDGRVV
ncbi:hypothetical protein UP10_26780 [Bradyrhizobium sp. LTSPM299]|nr:hypothetical protein UP10_26780 [Bradyrhizobium sp. LTSPM299]